MTGSDPFAYLGLTMPRRSEVIVRHRCYRCANHRRQYDQLVAWQQHRDVVPERHLPHRQRGGPLALLCLWFAVIVVTPIGEEVLFRGFLYRGWLRGPNDAWA